MMAVLTLACGVSETVFARIGKVQVEVEKLQLYMNNVAGVEWQNIDDQVAVRLTDQFLDQEVIANAAGRLDEVELAADPSTRSAMLRSLLPQVCGQPPRAPEEEILRVVAERAETIRGIRVHVRQVVMDDLDGAEAARARLVAGEEFLAVSREVSRAPNAQGGGELGFIEQGTLPIELEEVIFALGESEISEPIEGPAGFHVFQVLETVPAGPRPSAEIRVEVANELDRLYARKYVGECVERLANEAELQVFPDHLWFRYTGKYAKETNGV